MHKKEKGGRKKWEQPVLSHGNLVRFVLLEELLLYYKSQAVNSFWDIMLL